MTATRVYFCLLLLLALTVGAAFLPLGAWGAAVSLTIAFLKTLLVLIFFMKVRETSPLLSLAAGAAVLWLIFLFAVTFGDYLTRGTLGVLGK